MLLFNHECVNSWVILPGRFALSYRTRNTLIVYGIWSVIVNFISVTQ